MTRGKPDIRLPGSLNAGPRRSGRRRAAAALVYDFDGTLSPRNMQEYSFIPALGMEPAAFWEAVKRRAEEQNADPILAYMDMMLDKARRANVSIRRRDFVALGRHIELYPGVRGWFKRQTAYARRLGIRLEHYIVSSGLREMIEGTPIGKEFKAIYASGFMYDRGVATWPALALNYTGKTQFLFRINKGSFNVYDDTLINAFVKQEDRRVPFANMIYIGDGATDVPCMRLVKDQGGHSIAVFDESDAEAAAAASRLLEEHRVNFIAPASYSPGSPLDRQVRRVIDAIAAAEALRKLGKRG